MGADAQFARKIVYGMKQASNAKVAKADRWWWRAHVNALLELSGTIITVSHASCLNTLIWTKSNAFSVTIRWFMIQPIKNVLTALQPGPCLMESSVLLVPLPNFSIKLPKTAKLAPRQSNLALLPKLVNALIATFGTIKTVLRAFSQNILTFQAKPVNLAHLGSCMICNWKNVLIAQKRILISMEKSV